MSSATARGARRAARRRDALVLIYVADKLAVFAAPHRVLKPGGRISAASAL